MLCQLNLAYEEETIQEDVVQAVIPKVFPLAQAGDVAAQDELGDALTNLDHLTDASLSHLDVAKEAEHWFQKAAEAGSMTWRMHIGARQILVRICIKPFIGMMFWLKCKEIMYRML